MLAELGLERVDWLKLDSQGTDLRLFRSLGERADDVLVAELEPGIIDAYEGEDTLADVLADLGRRGLLGLGAERSRLDASRQLRSPGASSASARARYLDACHKPAPGWAEIEYFNDFADEERFGKRELLLGCAFAFLRGHDAFALELASEGRERFGSPFDDLRRDGAAPDSRRASRACPLAAAKALSGRFR